MTGRRGRPPSAPQATRNLPHSLHGNNPAVSFLGFLSRALLLSMTSRKVERAIAHGPWNQITTFSSRQARRHRLTERNPAVVGRNPLVPMDCKSRLTQAADRAL